MYKVAHVCIYVKDMEEAVNFYKEVLGFEIDSSRKTELLDFTYINANGVIIELIKHLDRDFEERTKGPWDHLAFYVDDIDAEIERLKSLGVKMSFEDTILSGNMKIMFFEGPNRERIEIIEII